MRTRPRLAARLESLEHRDVPAIVSGPVTAGHVEFLNVDVGPSASETQLALGAVQDVAGSAVGNTVDLAKTTFVVPPGAQTPRPGGPSFDFLGAGGKTVWVLP